MSLPPSYNLLKQHPNDIYIEAGVFRGDSIQLAMDAGFERIIGIELFQEHIDFCRMRFCGRMENVQLLQGDSAELLWPAIRTTRKCITFFLDSHSQLLEGEQPMKNPFPLLKELEQIRKHPVKNHTLIIDDYLYLTHQKVTGWVNGEIEAAIMAINPEYKIEYVANPIIGNLIVATV